ncbi:MAG: DUF4198 domain-containing protein [Pseudomonadota bacterium]
MSFRFVVFLAFSFACSSVFAHDTFLKLDRHYLQPNTRASVVLTNGTFETSENSVALERFRDSRITGPDSNSSLTPEASQWTVTERLNTLSFETGDSGTYCVGVSIKPRVLEMTVASFERYLRNDGVLDILEARQSSGPADGLIAEEYSKHVKALFQVGDKRTDSVLEPFGYPIEIVPLENPFDLSVGGILPVKVLRDGVPVKQQRVYASYAGFSTRSDSEAHLDAVATKTDENGIAQIPIEAAGRWYVRLIHMVPRTEPGLDYESNWATLTFEID